MDRSARRRHRKKERDARRKRRTLELIKKAEDKWTRRHRTLIRSLVEGAHNPVIGTRWVVNEAGSGAATKMSCSRCGLRYRGLLLRRWWGLSPSRPCIESHDDINRAGR